MNDEKLQAIIEILKDEYKDKMSDKAISGLADELYYSLFVGEYDLDDIPSIIFSTEADENIEEGGDWCYVFGQLIDLLENNEKTEKRLYKSFMFDFDLLDTCLKLAIENAEFLSADELAKAKQKAFGLFDREILEIYGIEE